MKLKVIISLIIVLLISWWIIIWYINQSQLYDKQKNTTLSGEIKNTIQTLYPEAITITGDTKQQLIKHTKNIMSEITSLLSIKPIEIKRWSCDEENAFYNPETKDITFCDEMINTLISYGKESWNNETEKTEIALHSSLFILLHEVGHALIDILQLPITGKEEDVADQIATYLIIELNKDNTYNRIMDGAFAFYRFGEQNPEIDEWVLADAHSLDKQRFYNIACRLYWATQDQNIISERWLPSERAEGCEDEYNLMKSSLDTLLWRTP